MNQKDKDKLSKLIGVLEEAHSEIETAQSEEQEKFDNMTEGLQQTERGQAIEQAANDLDGVANSLQEAIDKLADLINS